MENGAHKIRLNPVPSARPGVRPTEPLKHRLRFLPIRLRSCGELQAVLVRMRWGGRNGRSMAVAATALGGTTTAPSAIAAAYDIVGISVWATTATAAVVNPTA